MKDAFLMLIKIIFAVLLMPICYALTTSFLHELPTLGDYQKFFLWGVLLYVLLQLFFYTPQGVFQGGQKIFGEIFKGIPLLAAVVPLFIPIIPTIVLVGCYVTIAFFDYEPAKSYLIFLAGFTFAMHLILSAQAEFEEDTAGIKPHYLFLFSLTFIFNVLILALLLSINFSEFSITNVLMSSYDTAQGIYVAVYNQLFMIK